MTSLMLLLDLSDWAAIAQIVQCGFLILALLIAGWQVLEAGRARKLQATRELLNEIGGRELREARTWVLTEMPTFDAFDPTKLSKEDFHKALTVAVAYDRVGYMVEQHLIPEDALFRFQRDEIELLWQKLKPVVVHMRRAREHYCVNFEDLSTKWLGHQIQKQREGMSITSR
jgi:hypothetical protein